MGFEHTHEAQAQNQSAKPPGPKKISETREMVRLGHLAGKGPVPVARRAAGKPIPREARYAFGVALGMIVIMLLFTLLKAQP